MTSPDNVGTASVDIVADLKAFAAGLRSQVEAAFKGLDFDKLIRESVGNTPIRIPVDPDVKTDEIPAKVRAANVPKVPVDLDPVLKDFQSGIRSQVEALAHSINTKIPIGADTTELRADLGAQLAAISHELKAEIPTEPGARAEYEAKLKALVEEATARVKATVKVEPEVSKGPDLSGLSGLAGAITPNLLGGSAVSAVGALFSNLGQQVAQFASEAAQGGSELASGLASVAGPVGSIVGALAAAQAAVIALGGAATVLVPAFTAAAGAAAAIPAGLAGLGAAGGTLALGFKGISEAFKPVTGGGGGGGGGVGNQAAQQARQVASAGRQVEAARRGIAAANRALEAAERSLAAAERGVATAQRNEADAEQALADAQKKATQAQQAVNKARSEAADDLIDMNLQLKGSQLSEQEASLAVTNALRDLNAAKLTGNIPDIQAADLAYQRAQLTLQEASQSATELGKSTADANKKGVEGSDKVQSALQDQHDALEGVQKAQEGVTDAQNGVLDAADSLKSAQDGVLSAQDGIKSAADSLASAQDSLAQANQKAATSSAGAAAAAAKLIPLAPAAQRFVNAIKAIKPAFDDLRLDVQQHLFAGLDKTVTTMWNNWKTQLHTTLDSFADTFNGFAKNLGSAVSTPKFIGDLAAGAEGFRQGLAKIGDAITTSLVPAFGVLSRAAGPFLSKLGGQIANVITEFGNWINTTKSSTLTDFFARASTAMGSLFTTGKEVVKIIGDLLGIIFGAQAKSGKTPLDSLNDGLAKIDVWLSDPKHQQQIRDFITGLENGFKSFGQTASQINTWLSSLTGGSDAGGIGATIGRALVAGIIAGFGEGLTALLSSWVGYFLPTGPLIQPVLAALGIHSPSTVFAEIGKNLIAGLIQGIGSMLGALAAAAVSAANTVIKALAGSASWLVAAGKNAVIGLINGVGSLLGTLGSYAGNLRATVINATAAAGSWLVTAGRNAVIGLGNGIIGYYTKAASWAGQLRTAVTGALSNAGTLLVAAGKNIVIGLINGIAAEIGTLGSYLGSVTSFIQAHKGPPSKDKVLLFGAGQLIMGGLINGIADKKQELAAHLADVTDLVAGTTMPGLGSAADAALSASLSASTAQQVQVQWKTGTTGDQLLDAIAKVVDLRYGGSVNRAFTRA